MSNFIGHPSAVEDQPLPELIEIFAAYPNPFNARTIIEFSLLTSSQVELDIYDIIGRKISSLLDADLNPGRHAISFDASSLPSGLYFARLEATDIQSGVAYSKSIKLSLLK